MVIFKEEAEGVGSALGVDDGSFGDVDLGLEAVSVEHRLSENIASNAIVMRNDRDILGAVVSCGI